MKENWVYRRGDLYLANLGVPVGSKQGGVRPVVVLQNDVGNYYAPTITIAPLTSKIEKKRKQPTHFFLRKAKGLAKPSMKFSRLPTLTVQTNSRPCGKLQFRCPNRLSQRLPCSPVSLTGMTGTMQCCI